MAKYSHLNIFKIRQGDLVVNGKRVIDETEKICEVVEEYFKEIERLAKRLYIEVKRKAKANELSLEALGHYNKYVELLLNGYPRDLTGQIIMNTDRIDIMREMLRQDLIKTGTNRLSIVEIIDKYPRLSIMDVIRNLIEELNDKYELIDELLHKRDRLRVITLDDLYLRELRGLAWYMCQLKIDLIKAE